MRAYNNKSKDNIIQRRKDRRELMWRMEDEKEEKNQRSSLEIGDPDDKYEREADVVANKVVNGGAKHSSSSFIENDTSLMAKSENGTLHGTEQLQAKLDGSKGSGQSLDAATQNEMGSKMGADLSGVKIHTDSNAHEMSEGINAKAFTYGQDVYFKNGNYNTNSTEGKSLLAHELAHTQQQKNGLRRKIQRSMKVEIQTKNYIWAVKKTPAELKKENPNAPNTNPNYTPDTTLLGRKYGPNSKNFDDPQEKDVAYITTGKHGKSAKKAGHESFGKKEGDLKSFPILPAQYATEKINPDKKPQQTYVYKFKTEKSRESLLNTQLKEEDLILQEIITASPEESNPNTFQNKFLTTKGEPLENIHVDENNNFREGSVEFMRVKREHLDESKFDAETVEIWKVSKISENDEEEEKKQREVEKKEGKKAYIDYVDYDKKRLKIERISFSKNTGTNIIPGTYDKQYYDEKNFEKDNTLKTNAKPMEVHKDSGKLVSGRVEFMEKKVLEKDKEQTRMELQSESGGFIEFETPKWFRKWSELRDRIEDAKEMTDALNAQRDTDDDLSYKYIQGTVTPEEKSIVEDIRGKSHEKRQLDQHYIIRWPKELSTKHHSALNKSGYNLYVQITNYHWPATVQISEAIPLSQYSSLVREYEHETFGEDFADKLIAISEETIDILKDLTPAMQGKNSYNEYANLKGFLQLIANYIWRGYRSSQRGEASKATFRILARSDFASMYRTILNKEEKELFKSFANNKSSSMDKFIDKISKTIGGNATMSKDMTFFRVPVGTKTSEDGPIIEDWIKSMVEMGDKDKGKDTLSTWPNMSAAQGAKTVSDEAGDKDYKLAQFEMRGMKKDANDNVFAADWVKFVEERFKTAAARSADTPDNLATKDKDEASNTGLVYDP